MGKFSQHEHFENICNTLANVTDEINCLKGWIAAETLADEDNVCRCTATGELRTLGHEIHNFAKECRDDMESIVQACTLFREYISLCSSLEGRKHCPCSDHRISRFSWARINTMIINFIRSKCNIIDNEIDDEFSKATAVQNPDWTVFGRIFPPLSVMLIVVEDHALHWCYTLVSHVVAYIEVKWYVRRFLGRGILVPQSSINAEEAAMPRRLFDHPLDLVLIHPELARRLPIPVEINNMILDYTLRAFDIRDLPASGFYAKEEEYCIEDCPYYHYPHSHGLHLFKSTKWETRNVLPKMKGVEHHKDCPCTVRFPTEADKIDSRVVVPFDPANLWSTMERLPGEEMNNNIRPWLGKQRTCDDIDLI